MCVGGGGGGGIQNFFALITLKQHLHCQLYLISFGAPQYVPTQFISSRERKK